MIAMLEIASVKIDRFGWDRMDQNLKDELCADWCDILGKYMLDEVNQGIRDFFSENKGKARSINEHQVESHILAAHRKITDTLVSLGNDRKEETLRIVSPEQKKRADDMIKKAGYGMRMKK